MRPSVLATAAACILMLARLPITTVAGQTNQPPVDPAALYQQPPLSGVEIAFAYDRMNGITPDFRRYAERSSPTTAATAFDRDAVLGREIARTQQQFENFDVGKTFSIRLRTDLRQYDTARSGYALGLSEESFITLHDLATFKDYSLHFRNISEANFIGVGDPNAARAFAQRTRLNMQGPLAGSVVLQMAFRLVEAPPLLDNGGPLVVRADVLAARVLDSSTGHVIFDFGLTQAANRSMSGAESGTQSTLKAAEVQGLHLGMSQTEADAIASRGWTTKRGSPQAGQELWFNGLQVRQDDWAVCGDLINGFPPPMDFTAGVSPPSYKDCIGYGFARVGAGNGAYSDRVGQVASEQFLAGGDAGTLRRALEEKYGKATYVRDGGSDLVWVGRDPSKPDGEPVKIEAKLGVETGPARNRVVLQILMTPYVDPRRPQPAVAQPSATGGPKL